MASGDGRHDLVRSSSIWHHFGVGVPPILVFFSGDWDVHWGYGLLTHGPMTTEEYVGPTWPAVGKWDGRLFGAPVLCAIQKERHRTAILGRIPSRQTHRDDVPWLFWVRSREHVEPFSQ